MPETIFGGEILNLLKDIRTGGHREVVRHDGNELELRKVIQGGMSLTRFIIGYTCMTFYLLTSEFGQTCLDYSLCDRRVINHVLLPGRVKSDTGFLRLFLRNATCRV